MWLNYFNCSNPLNILTTSKLNRQTMRRTLLAAVLLIAACAYGKNEISLWCNNIFNKDYSLFYFDSGSAGFMQKGKGTWAGIDLRLRF